MKFIVAIIKPFRLESVCEALTALGVEGLTVSEVRGYGRQKGHAGICRGADDPVRFQPKVKIEIAVKEEAVESAIEAIRAAAYNGQVGDGKIFAFDLQHVLRIRTSETDNAAL